MAYIGCMVLRSSRGRPLNAPAALIHPCQPLVAKQPPSGPGWAHELKHDGYRLQIHVRNGRVRLYTMNGADWSKRYPAIEAKFYHPPLLKDRGRTACDNAQLPAAFNVTDLRCAVNFSNSLLSLIEKLNIMQHGT